MKASELVFNRVHDAPPGFICNVCAHRYTLSQWHMADVPIHKGKDTASIVICSKACMRRFLGQDDADQKLTDFIRRSEKMKPLPPTPEETQRMEEMLQRAMGGVFGGKLKLGKPIQEWS